MLVRAEAKFKGIVMLELRLFEITTGNLEFPALQFYIA